MAAALLPIQTLRRGGSHFNWSGAGVLLVLALLTLPVWSFQFFPSEDGPSHLYNALVLAHYGATPAFRDYFIVRPSIVGNLLTELLLTALVKLTPPLIAEKLLITAYVILFPLAFWAALKKIAPRSRFPMCLLCLPFVYSSMLHWGFWNFCFSLILLLFFIAFVAGRRQWHWRAALMASLLCGLLYIAHLIALLAGIAVLLFTILVSAIEKLRRGDFSRQAAWELARPILATAPWLLGPFLFAARGSRGLVYSLGLRDAVWQIYSIAPLHVSSFDVRFGKILFVTLALAAALDLSKRVRTRAFERRDRFLAVALLFFLAGVFGPDAIGEGSFLRPRVILCGYLLFLLWLAGGFTARRVAALVPLAAVAATALLLVARIPIFRDYNARIQEFRSVGGAIARNGDVLALVSKAGAGSRMSHAEGLLTFRPFIDLKNYEAATDDFLVAYRTTLSPVPALGTLTQLNTPGYLPAIAAYERYTGRKIDYVLLYADRDRSLAKRFQSENPSYRLCKQSEPLGLVQLYCR